MTEIQNRFDELYDCIVKELKYDHMEAKFLLCLYDAEKGINHIVVFNDVNSCLFTMMGFEGEICKNIYPELSSILLSSISIKTNDKWLSAYPLEYNICIEIMDRAVLLNAHSVQIDSDLFTEPYV